VILILKYSKLEEYNDGKRDESKYREFERKCNQWSRRDDGGNGGDGADGDSGYSGVCGTDGVCGDSRTHGIDGNSSNVKSFYDLIR
jgi:hypothetical protein